MMNTLRTVALSAAARLFAVPHAAGGRLAESFDPLRSVSPIIGKFGAAPWVSLMSSDHLECLSTGSTLSPISLTPRLSHSGFRLPGAASSVRETGVKSFGCEKSIVQLLPIQSWNLILPSVVSASKSGAVVPIGRAMLRPHVIRVKRKSVTASIGGNVA